MQKQELQITNECSFTSSKMENVSLDVIVLSSMYHLFAFYKREIERSMHQCVVVGLYKTCPNETQLICLAKKLFLIQKILFIKFG